MVYLSFHGQRLNIITLGNDHGLLSFKDRSYNQLTNDASLFCATQTKVLVIYCNDHSMFHTMNHTYHTCIRIQEWFNHPSMVNTILLYSLFIIM